MIMFNDYAFGKITNIIIYLYPANIFVAVIGLVISIFALFSRQYATSSKSIGACVHIFIFVWLLLLWADSGSVFTPVVSTVLSRYAVLLINILILVSVRVPEKIHYVKIPNGEPNKRSSERV